MIDASSMNINRWILSIVTPIHLHSFEGKKTGCLNANVYGVQNSSTACWRLVTVVKRSCKLTVALHYCCLPVKALLRYCRHAVFNTQSTNSRLHTFALRLPVILPPNERGWMGITWVQLLNIHLFLFTSEACIIANVGEPSFSKISFSFFTFLERPVNFNQQGTSNPPASSQCTHCPATSPVSWPLCMVKK